jgi:hypothetical protein
MGDFFEHFEGYSEHGIFHGITNYQENKPLNIKDKKGLFTIEWNRARRRFLSRGSQCSAQYR